MQSIAEFRIWQASPHRSSRHAALNDDPPKLYALHAKAARPWSALDFPVSWQGVDVAFACTHQDRAGRLVADTDLVLDEVEEGFEASALSNSTNVSGMRLLREVCFRCGSIDVSQFAGDVQTGVANDDHSQHAFVIHPGRASGPLKAPPPKKKKIYK